MPLFSSRLQFHHIPAIVDLLDNSSCTNYLNVLATARTCTTQIIGIPCGRNKDSGESEKSPAGIAVARVHGQGVARDARDIEVGDTVGVRLAGVTACIGVAEAYEVSVEPLAVVDHRFGRVGADVGGVCCTEASESGARGDKGGSGLVGKGKPMEEGEGREVQAKSAGKVNIQ